MTVLLRAKSLKTAEKMVALSLAFKMDADGRSHITQREICALASISKPTLKRTVRSLEDKIGLEDDTLGHKNTYRFAQWRAL